MIEFWKAKLNNVSNIGAIIMDLSEAFDSPGHDLLLAKLEAHSLENNTVSFMRYYLKNKLQCCKINNSFSEWAKISTGVPQGPLHFNIFINDIFLFIQKCYLKNYIDDTYLNGFTIISWFLTQNSSHLCC